MFCESRIAIVPTCFEPEERKFSCHCRGHGTGLRQEENGFKFETVGIGLEKEGGRPVRSGKVTSDVHTAKKLDIKKTMHTSSSFFYDFEHMFIFFLFTRIVFISMAQCEDSSYSRRRRRADRSISKRDVFSTGSLGDRGRTSCKGIRRMAERRRATD